VWLLKLPYLSQTHPAHARAENNTLPVAHRRMLLLLRLLHPAGDKLTGSFEADGSSLLQLSYCLESAAQHANTITDPATGQTLPGPPTAAGATDPAAATAADEAEAPVCTNSSSSSGVMSLRLPFWLEFPSRATAAATATMRATLLGPFSGKVGHPMTLSWQLSRLGGWVLGGTDLAGFSTVDLGSSPPAAAAAASQDDGSSTPQQQQQQHVADGSSSSSGHEGLDEVLCYEIVPGEPSKAAAGSSLQQQQDPLHTSLQRPNALAALLQQQQQDQNPKPEAKRWWTGGSASGMVRLGRSGGALASVEVVIVPKAAGRQLPPQLLLRGLGGNQQLLVECGVAGGLWVEEEMCMHISA
jgi:hypothetical protein